MVRDLTTTNKLERGRKIPSLENALLQNQLTGIHRPQTQGRAGGEFLASVHCIAVLK